MFQRRVLFMDAYVIQLSNRLGQMAAAGGLRGENAYRRPAEVAGGKHEMQHDFGLARLTST
jgi:hypothetical protein